jgi:hypothetical protein
MVRAESGERNLGRGGENELGFDNAVNGIYKINSIYDGGGDGEDTKTEKA